MLRTNNELDIDIVRNGILKSISDLPTSVLRFFCVLLLTIFRKQLCYLKLESSKRGGKIKVHTVNEPHSPKLGHRLPELFSIFLAEGQSCWLHSSTGKKETKNYYKELENVPAQFT